jgi:hypothetical protein
MTMLPDLLWWLTIDLALIVGVAIAAHRASCGRHVRRMWSSADGTDQITGLIVLFVPCKGAEPELADNLIGMFQQQRVDYEIRFIVEDASDSALPVIEELRRQHPQIASSIVIAGRAVDSGQKIHNLRVATERLPEACCVLAFADSDIRPSGLWLQALTHTLTRPEVGASSGYRWFVPRRLTLANLLVFSMNAGAAACLGRRAFNLIWGGSWAIRREHFEQTGLRDAWRGTLNDDLVATRVVRGAGLKIEFEPRCLCLSPLDLTWPQALNFIHRQLLQARFYASAHFWWGAAAVGVQAIAVCAAAFAVIRVVIGGESSLSALCACALLVLVSGLRTHVGHSTWRERFTEAEGQIRWARRLDYLAGPLLALLAAACVVRTCFSDTMVWRGLRYRLYGGGQAMFLGRQLEVGRGREQACTEDQQEPVILPMNNRRAA